MDTGSNRIQHPLSEPDTPLPSLSTFESRYYPRGSRSLSRPNPQRTFATSPSYLETQTRMPAPYREPRELVNDLVEQLDEWMEELDQIKHDLDRADADAKSNDDVETEDQIPDFDSNSDSDVTVGYTTADDSSHDNDSDETVQDQSHDANANRDRDYDVDRVTTNNATVDNDDCDDLRRAPNVIENGWRQFRQVQNHIDLFRYSMAGFCGVLH